LDVALGFALSVASLLAFVLVNATGSRIIARYKTLLSLMRPPAYGRGC
jgi:hypothetical protein